ncbi:hypothetical protein [Pandoravirus japonicus]|uniref:Uncharacterized protein n=1 Tax=Pandoravirus japonicus TaxID=2823154 RepID=A0A811BQR9_9VIRU|nr:hypothetical protein [Pandoravirus japonicus]BCU03152.1 hypothetical protein [Pandoravirus japonicus]
MTVALSRAAVGDVPWAEVQRREIRALRAARVGARKGARGPPAVYVVLHRLYRYFTAISRHAAPEDAPVEAEAAASPSARHSAVQSGGGDDDVPVYACFDDVCANEVGVQRYAAHRAIKETLLASLFQQVIAPAAARDGLRDCVASDGCRKDDDNCDDGQQQQQHRRRCAHKDDRGGDTALAAETAPSSYRCLLALVSEWSAPVDWIDWSPDELQTWIEAPERAALLNTLVSVWRGAKARAIADRDADMEKGRRRGQGRGRRSAMLQIIRGHIEAAFKDAGGGGSPTAAASSSSPCKRNFSASATTTATGHERVAGPEGGVSCGADQRALKRPRLSHEKDDARSREVGQSEPSLARDAAPSAGDASLDDDAPNGYGANLVAPRASVMQTTCAAVEPPQRPALAARSGATDDKVEAAVRGLLTAAVSGNNDDGGGSDDDDTSVDALISAIDAVRPILLRRQQRQRQRRQTRLGEPGGSPLAG